MLTKIEEATLHKIQIASENNPHRPEFPPQKPKFPATPTYLIDVPHYSNVWIKDESVNPTGTHKDRMAWEIIVTYRDFLLAKKKGLIKGKLPAMSIISSGSAAIAIQTMLRSYQLPNLRALVDWNMDSFVKKYLKKMGCHVYETNLSQQVLSWDEILSRTSNESGFDITSSYGLDPGTRFYDWMSYEIINQSPHYVFIPFGTGNLYENILNINRREITTRVKDPRFEGRKENLQQCHFMGAASDRFDSLANKLYSPHLPFSNFNEQWIRLYHQAGYCGQKSNVYLFEEKFLLKAMDLADDLKIACEPSGIAGMALFFQIQKKINPTDKVLIVNTGKTKYE